MDTEQKYLLALTKSAMWKQEAPLPPEGLDWNRVLQEAAEGRIDALLYRQIQTLPVELQPMQMEIYAQAIEKQCKQKRKDYTMLQRILDEAEDRNIQFVLFKGPIFAHLYPDYTLRYSANLDMLVSLEELEAATELLEYFGYNRKAHSSKQCVVCFYHKDGSVIELHTKLWEDVTARQDRCFEQLQLDCEEAFVNQTACGTEVTTLGVMEHLMYEYYHIVEQLSFQGTELRHFVDVTYYVNKNINKLDKELFWKHMEQVHYKTFGEAFCQICVYYFGMDPEILPGESWETQRIEDLISRFFEVGLLGSKRTETKVASGIVYHSYCEQYEKKSGRKKMWKVTLFPGVKDLSMRYNYARKHSWLLPIAWVQRACRYVIYLLSPKRRQTVAEPMRQAQQKIEVLQELDIIKKSR